MAKRKTKGKATKRRTETPRKKRQAVKAKVRGKKNQVEKKRRVIGVDPASGPDETVVARLCDADSTTVEAGKMAAGLEPDGDDVLDNDGDIDDEPDLEDTDEDDEDLI